MRHAREDAQGREHGAEMHGEYVEDDGDDPYDEEEGERLLDEVEERAQDVVDVFARRPGALEEDGSQFLFCE